MIMHITNRETSKHKRLQAALWIIFYLIVLDIIINIVFKFPEDPAKTSPSFLQGYFEYGRSVEGKIDRFLNSSNDQSAPILGYGWLQDEKYASMPKKAVGNQTLVALYGMSHTKLLGEAMAKIDSNYGIRIMAGPGVPPGWSFAAWRADMDSHEADVVILGMMTESIAYLSATSGSTSYFDLGHPYTFPRYRVENSVLKEIYPPFYSEEGFRDHLSNPVKWAIYKDWLKSNDDFYSPILFNKSLLDKSALFRVLRRAYAESFREKRIGRVHTKNGFNMSSEQIIALHKIVETFASEVRQRGKLPILYIVNNQGHGDHLYRALKPVIDKNNIQHLSTHVMCPPDDPRVFIGINSHFTESKDIELAGEMVKIIERWKSGRN